MRLTLRTLLAYLDDVLEPTDAQELATRIDDSDFASGLVHRVRNTVGRLRLPAPQLSGTGIAENPNTVSEYLDNTLPKERIPEFERVCLESDMHLGEVAASHQILTLVLGEPTEVSPALRQRVYRVVHGPEAALDTDQAERNKTRGAPSWMESDAGNSFDGTADRQDAVASSAIRRVDVPTPQKIRRRRRVSSLAIAGSIVAVLAVGYLSWRGLNGDYFRGFPDGAGLWTAANSDGNSKLHASSSGNEHGTVFRPTRLANQQEAVSSEIDHHGAKKRLALTQPASTRAPRTERALENRRDNVAFGTDVMESPIPPHKVESGQDKLLLDVGTELDEPFPSDKNPSIIAHVSDSSGHLLMQVDSNSDWNVVLPGSAVHEAAKLVMLPTMQSTLSLNTDILATVSGPSRLQIGIDADTENPEIVVDYGRVLLGSDNGPGWTVLRVGERAYRIQLSESCRVVVTVQGIRAPGSDPESDLAHAVVRAWGEKGVSTWVDPQTGIESTLEPRHLLTFVDDEDGWTSTASAPPTWYQEASRDDIDRRSSVELRKRFDANSISPRMILLKLANRRVPFGTRSLAARCLVHLGEYGPVIDTLSDTSQRGFWIRNVAELRDALTHGTDHAQAIRLALQSLRGKSGMEIYRLLWGFDRADLKDGTIDSTVSLLNHESLDVRVVSHLTLWNATGIRSGYRPDAAARSRQTTQQRWRRLVQNGEIGRHLHVSALPTSVAID